MPISNSSFNPPPALLLSVASQALATYVSADITVSKFKSLALDVNITAITGGTSPTATFRVLRKDNAGNYFPIDTPTPLSAAGPISRSIGPGQPQNAVLSDIIRVEMVTTGAPTSVTASLVLYGRYA